MTRLTLFALFSTIVFLVTSYAAPDAEYRLGKRDDGLPARVPYNFPAPGTNPTADAIRARRANGTLLDLDGALLDNIPVAAGWTAYFTVVRDNSTLPAAMRELVILRTAALNDATYVWLQHEPDGRAAGLTTAQLRLVRLAPAFAEGAEITSTLGPSLSAALSYSDWVARSVHVPDNVFDNLKKHLDLEQLIDITALAGGYALVCRFTVALNLDSKMNMPVPIPS